MDLLDLTWDLTWTWPGPGPELDKNGPQLFFNFTWKYVPQLFLGGPHAEKVTLSPIIPNRKSCDTSQNFPRGHTKFLAWSECLGQLKNPSCAWGTVCCNKTPFLMDQTMSKLGPSKGSRNVTFLTVLGFTILRIKQAGRNSVMWQTDGKTVRQIRQHKCTCWAATSQLKIKQNWPDDSIYICLSISISLLAEGLNAGFLFKQNSKTSLRAGSEARWDGDTWEMITCRGVSIIPLLLLTIIIIIITCRGVSMLTSDPEAGARVILASSMPRDQMSTFLLHSSCKG